MRFERLLPSPALAPYVRLYDYFEVKTSPGEALSWTFLPDGYPELGLNLSGAPVRFYTDPDTTEERMLPAGYFLGQYSRSGTFMIEQEFRAFHVKFFPWAMSHFSDLRGIETSNSILLLQDVFLRKNGNLNEQLADEQDISKMKMLVEAFIRSTLFETNDRNDLLKAATVAIHEHMGMIRVETIAGTLGVSRRWLDMLFKRHYGITPKQYCKILRLRKFSRLLSDVPGGFFTPIVYDCGYSDQSHFIRDFRHVVGKTPRDYFQNNPFVSDFCLK